MILRAAVSGLVLLFMATSAAAASAPSPAVLQKIAPWVLQKTEAGQAAEFLLVLGDQADLTPAAALETKAEKGRFVYETLFKRAQETQAPLLADLRARGVEHRSYYIVNMIWVKGDRALALDMAARGDVARIDGNPVIHNVLPRAQDQSERISSPNAPGANISYVRAPEVWALSITGSGVVVGGQDTGVDWNHPALKPHYRGWNGLVADHNFNWHDSIHVANPTCPANSPQPCDDVDHGTHTMGTFIGEDTAGNQIGMAPGAKWIGCRNMNAGDGTPATYLECFEFFLAPYPLSGTPADGDPTKAPDVTNNSWGCPASEGCVASSLLAAVQAQRAAGIATVVSAGNSGASGCSTVEDPPATYDEVFSVGALNTGADTLAGFSSRGPVLPSNRVKPDIAAPGTNVRSSVPGGTYASAGWSGTSMAGPHVAGAMALLQSAAPALNGNVDVLEQCLAASAVHISSTACGSTTGVFPNNLFGYGRLDVLAAVQLLLSNVSIGVAGSTSIGSPSCVGGTATVTDTAGGTNTHQWGYRTTSGGPITFIPGQTASTYQLHCGNFPSAGTYRLVERTTPQCGVPTISNEIVVTVNATPVELQTFGVD